MASQRLSWPGGAGAGSGSSSSWRSQLPVAATASSPSWSVSPRTPESRVSRATYCWCSSSRRTGWYLRAWRSERKSRTATDRARVTSSSVVMPAPPIHPTALCANRSFGLTLEDPHPIECLPRRRYRPGVTAMMNPPGRTGGNAVSFWHQLELARQFLNALVGRAAPALAGTFGVGPHIAAQLLATAGDSPECLGSEAASAQLCANNASKPASRSPHSPTPSTSRPHGSQPRTQPRTHQRSRVPSPRLAHRNRRSTSMEIRGRQRVDHRTDPPTSARAR